jgi:uncharacterized protein (DUF1778 family)
MRAQISKTKRTVKTLEDRRSFVLDKNRWDEFLKVLGRPSPHQAEPRPFARRAERP